MELAIDVGELQLRTSQVQGEERFRLAVEAAPSAMVAVDSLGQIVFANTLAQQLFGYAREELIGNSVDILVPERFRPRTRLIGPISLPRRRAGRWAPAGSCLRAVATAANSRWKSGSILRKPPKEP